MSVLDVGCGVRDVSLLAASIGTARERARAGELGDVAFEEGDLAGLDPGRSFDDLVGRRVEDPEAGERPAASGSYTRLAWRDHASLRFRLGAPPFAPLASASFGFDLDFDFGSGLASLM